MRFKEIEKILLRDGWSFEKARGSYYKYLHPTKLGKVTIPYHNGDIDKGTVKSIMNQAGLK